MPTVTARSGTQEHSGLYSGPIFELDLNTTVAAWHAPSAGGAPIAWVAGFAMPSVAECARIPQMALAAGGAAHAYAIVGTWNGAAQTDTITTVAAATVTATKPFDTVTSVSGADPVAALTFETGDAYCDPPARLLWTGSGGNAVYQLEAETTMRAVARVLPAQGELVRTFRRFQATTTTLTNAHVGF